MESSFTCKGLSALKVLIGIGLVVFLGPFGGNMVLSMFGSLKESFNADVFWVTMGITAYMIPFSFAQLFSGAFSDIVYGRVKPVVYGLLTYSIGAFGVAFSPNIFSFLLFRSIQGLGNAFAFPISMAIVGDCFPRELRGRIMGFLSLSSTLGISLGPLFGGYISPVNWRLGFLILALAFTALSAYFYFAVKIPNPPSLKEASHKAPLKVLAKLVTNIDVFFLSLVGFIVFFVRAGSIAYISDTLFTPPFSLSSDVIAWYLSLAGIGGLIGSIVAGFLIDVLGRVASLIIGESLLMLTFVVFLSENWFNLLALLMVTLGFSATIAFTALNTLVVEIKPLFRGTASSIYSSFRFLGYALGPLLLYIPYAYCSLKGVVTVCAIFSTATLIATVFMMLRKKR